VGSGKRSLIGGNLETAQKIPRGYFERGSRLNLRYQTSPKTGLSMWRGDLVARWAKVTSGKNGLACVTLGRCRRRSIVKAVDLSCRL
jgi:hypothetical protein